MSTTREDRLCKVFDYLVFRGKVKTRQEFAEAVGINKTNLSSAMNGNEKYLSDSLFIKVNSVYDNINLQWLLTGDGEMLNPQAAIMTSAEEIEPIPDQQAAVIDAIKQGAQVVTDAKTIGATMVSPDVYEEIAEEIKEEMAIPIISREIANTPHTDIKKYVKDNSDELKRIYVNDLTQGAKVAECVESISMWPTFQPGDWVFVKFIDKDSIIDGKTYYFDLNTLPTMIRKVKIEGDKLRLIAKNPTFGDIVIGHSEVNNIAKIVGMFRSYFGDQYDEIEEVRRKKDEQVNNLIEQNGKALQIIKDLIKK